ncbi:hypothetical protein Y032_0011g1255 [Ancylostoma ceylanicum]|uniref:Uncharacterized protein n=1 Tax=Ancylostoma ceylanicum TaxID=53326 RepID=A0A016VEU8_9BILA|nr:hypothetical protein Y032_0011g1255 [Ancylostoma ceylanicum]
MIATVAVSAGLAAYKKKWAESPIPDEEIHDCVLEFMKYRPELEHPGSTTEAPANEEDVPPAGDAAKAPSKFLGGHKTGPTSDNSKSESDLDL